MTTRAYVSMLIQSARARRFQARLLLRNFDMFGTVFSVGKLRRCFKKMEDASPASRCLAIRRKGLTM